MASVLANDLDKSSVLKLIRSGDLAPQAALSLLRRTQERSQEPVPSEGPWEERFLEDLTGVVADLLRIDSKGIDLDMPVTEMGLDSLSATELNNQMRTRFGLSLQATAFFECSTIRDFHGYILRVFGEHLHAHYGGNTDSPADTAVSPEKEEPEAKSAAGRTVRADPILENLRLLWSESQEEALAEVPGDAYTGPFSRLLIESADRPRIEVCCVGQGRPVLLLGGLMNPEGIWKNQVEALVDDFRLIAFNKPGCGRSEVDTRRLDMDSIVENICVALDTLNLTEPLDVVGFSFGGMLAQKLAVAQPHRVAGLALINTTGRVRPRADDAMILKEEISRCPEIVSINGEIDFALAAHYRETSSKFDMQPNLGRVTASSMVIAAHGDTYIPRGQAQELADALPDSKYVEIPGDAGHFSLLTHAAEINRHLLNFLSRDANSQAS